MRTVLLATALLLGASSAACNDEETLPSDHDAASDASHTDTGDAAADTTDDATDDAWALALQAAQSSRTHFESLLAAHEGVLCVWQSWSSWVGFGWASRVQFDDEALVAWEFCETELQCPGCGRAYTCEEGSADTPPSSERVPPRALESMSALYARCIDQVLTLSPQDWEAPTFEVDSAGLMTRCTARMANCNDDCVQGVGVERLEWAACDFEVPRDRDEGPP